MIKSSIEKIKNLGFFGALEFIFPNASRDVIIAVGAWLAYLIVRFVRGLFRAQWTLQAVIKNRFAWPLTKGVILDIIWSTLNTNPEKTTPWWLNWVPVIWEIGPGWVKSILLVVTLITFGDVVWKRLAPLIKHLPISGMIGVAKGVFSKFSKKPPTPPTP